MSPAERDGLDRDVVAWRSLLGEAAFEADLAAGRRWPLDRATIEALAVVHPPSRPLPVVADLRPAPRRAGVGGVG